MTAADGLTSWERPVLAWHQWKNTAAATGLPPPDIRSVFPKAYEAVTRPAVFRQEIHGRRHPPTCLCRGRGIPEKPNPTMEPDGGHRNTCKSGTFKERPPVAFPKR